MASGEPLTDLRGRVDEPRVRALLRLAAGSDDAARRSLANEWIPIGWEEAGEVVACAAVSRDEDGGLELHAIAVAPDRQRRGIGRSLVEALADVANARRLVAEADDDCAGFYRSCGFDVEPAGEQDGRARVRCVRELDATPAPEALALTLGEIEAAITAAWSAETSDDPTTWSSSNPARNHCDVTALVVRELLGGEILIANVVRDGERLERHAWNRLPSGIAIDLTRSQFQNGEQLTEPRVNEPMLLGRGSERYELFAGRVRARLGL